MTNSIKQPARTSTFNHSNTHPGEFYKSPLVIRVYEEAQGKPYGWGIMREEQLGCEIAARLLVAELDNPARRVVRSSVARALFSTACYGFNGSQPILHIQGREPSYRNVRLPRLDIPKFINAEKRQANIVERLGKQGEDAYPTILKSIESGMIFTKGRIERNARVLGECSLELAAIPIVELEVPFSDFEVQDFAAMSANTLKTEVARATARDNATPSIRQFIRRGSPAIHELMASPIPEVSDLAWEVCRDL